MVATTFSSITGASPLTSKYMAEEAIEEQDSQPVEEATPQETEVVAEDLAEKNKQLYERAKKAEAKVKELEKKPAPLQTNESSSTSDERFERLELKTEGYSGDEVDFLMQNGGRKALDNKIAMAGIEAIRKAKKSTDATPSGTAKSAVYQKFTEQDLRRMSAEELEKIIPQ